MLSVKESQTAVYPTLTTLHSVLYTVNLFVVVCGSAKETKSRKLSPLINSSHLLDSIFEGYDKRLGPFIFAGEATLVRMGLYITEMQTVEDQRMEYIISAYFRRAWKDPRLAYDVTHYPNVSYLNMPPDLLPKLWVPDVYFVNEREGEAHSLTTINALLWIYPNGDVFVSSKLTLRLACPMNMQKFPMDTQYCKVEIESYSHNTDHITFDWLESKLEVPANLHLAQFTLLKRDTEDCTNYYSTSSSPFPCLRGVFVLKRKYNYHLISTFIPSGFIVVVSWVSFWISPDAVPGRVTLGVTTVLTMITQSFITGFTLPQVPYVKATDVWMAASMTFVFAALLEYALVNVVQRKQILRKTQALQRENTVNLNRIKQHQNGIGTEIGSIHSLASLMAKIGSDSSAAPVKGTAFKIDLISRIGFPIVFSLFSICFWGFYILWEPKRPDLRMASSE